jgi:preprotein translocase subunit SecE
LGVRVPLALNTLDSREEKTAMRKLWNFLVEVRAELKKVTWPTWIEVFSSTIVVIITTLIFAALIGVWDKVLMEIMLRIL